MQTELRVRSLSNGVGALLLIVGSFSAPALCQYVAEFSSFYDGERYVSRLTQDELAKTPPWRDGNPNPPLSVGQAKSAAAAYLKEQLGDSDQWKWRLVEISLHPIADRWVYLISFAAPVKDPTAAPFTVVVTMDGIVVQPSISSYTATQATSDSQKQLLDAQGRCMAWLDDIKRQVPPSGGTPTQSTPPVDEALIKQLRDAQDRCIAWWNKIKCQLPSQSAVPGQSALPKP